MLGPAIRQTIWAKISRIGADRASEVDLQPAQVTCNPLLLSSLISSCPVSIMLINSCPVSIMLINSCPLSWSIPCQLFSSAPLVIYYSDQLMFLVNYFDQLVFLVDLFLICQSGIRFLRINFKSTVWVYLQGAKDKQARVIFNVVSALTDLPFGVPSWCFTFESLPPPSFFSSL